MATEDFDVFISFSGEIRRNFTCDVSRKGFKPFMDCESIILGDEIQETIDKAIKHSKSAVVILSDEYASSKPCLNELVLFLEQKNRTSKFFIIPVFYYVNTDDVKHQSGKFGAAFEHIKNKHEDDRVDNSTCQYWRHIRQRDQELLCRHINLRAEVALLPLRPLHSSKVGFRSFTRIVMLQV